MPTDLELLETGRTVLVTAISTDIAKADYSIDGQSVSRKLLEKLKLLNEMISVLGGPIEVLTEGHV